MPSKPYVRGPWLLNPYLINYYPNMLEQAMTAFGVDMDKPLRTCQKKTRTWFSTIRWQIPFPLWEWIWWCAILTFRLKELSIISNVAITRQTAITPHPDASLHEWADLRNLSWLSSQWPGLVCPVVVSKTTYRRNFRPVYRRPLGVGEPVNLVGKKPSLLVPFSKSRTVWPSLIMWVLTIWPCHAQQEPFQVGKVSVFVWRPDWFQPIWCPLYPRWAVNWSSPEDNDRLIASLKKKMRDLGNTLIVVEHDEILCASWLSDWRWPWCRCFGGEIVAAGTPKQVARNSKSITGQYLSGKRAIPVPEERRAGNGRFIEVTGARENNLQNITARFPLGKFIAVTGVSGSGSRPNQQHPQKSHCAEAQSQFRQPGKFKTITGIEHVDRLIDIDQSPIGRTPRSNPATYTGVFDDIRDLFAQTNEAKIRGYKKGRFSFNVKGGRCEACSGDGIIKIEMHFLPMFTWLVKFATDSLQQWNPRSPL